MKMIFYFLLTGSCLITSSTMVKAEDAPPASWNAATAGIGLQLATEGCKACRQRCADSRDQCKASACTRSGGKPHGAQACDGVTNEKVYIDGLKACEAQERTCWNQCQAGACR